MSATPVETMECPDCENERPVSEMVEVTKRHVGGPRTHLRCRLCCRVWSATFAALPTEDDEDESEDD